MKWPSQAAALLLAALRDAELRGDLAQQAVDAGLRALKLAQPADVPALVYQLLQLAGRLARIERPRVVRSICGTMDGLLTAADASDDVDMSQGRAAVSCASGNSASPPAS